MDIQRNSWDSQILHGSRASLRFEKDWISRLIFEKIRHFTGIIRTEVKPYMGVPSRFTQLRKDIYKIHPHPSLDHVYIMVIKKVADSLAFVRFESKVELHRFARLSTWVSWWCWCCCCCWWWWWSWCFLLLITVIWWCDVDIHSMGSDHEEDEGGNKNTLKKFKKGIKEE